MLLHRDLETNASSYSSVLYPVMTVVAICVSRFGPVGELRLVGVMILDGFTAADRPIAKVAFHQTAACSWWISVIAA